MLSRYTVFVLLLASCSSPKARREWKPSDHAQPEEQQPAQAMTPAELEQATVSSLWQAQCVSCHSADGTGGGPGVPAGATLPNFADAAWQATRTDEQLTAAVTTGKGVMPAFAGRLTGEQIALLVRRIRLLGGPGPQTATSP